MLKHSVTSRMEDMLRTIWDEAPLSLINAQIAEVKLEQGPYRFAAD
jgi:hypothetical protein